MRSPLGLEILKLAAVQQSYSGFPECKVNAVVDYFMYKSDTNMIVHTDMCLKLASIFDFTVLDLDGSFL